MVQFRGPRRRKAWVGGFGSVAFAAIVSAVPAVVHAPAALAAPANQAPTSAVALVADPGGFDHAFYRGEDGAVYVRTFDDGVWSTQSSLGGRIAGAPAATVSGSRLLVAVRGLDSALWLRERTAGAWGPWRSVGGVLSAAPAAAFDESGGLHVVVRGAGDQLWSRSRTPGGAWSSWIGLSGAGFTSAPAVVSSPGGRLDVYVAAADNTVVRRTRAGGTWSGWQSLGGRTYTAPAAARNPVTGASVVAVRGTNDVVYLNHSDQGAWSGWQSQGGLLVDAPGVAFTVDGGIDLVGRGRTNVVYAATRRVTWSGWVRAWTPAAPTPPAPSLLGTDWTRVPTSEPVVALTFDAGSGAGGLASIRRTLLDKNVPATFFFTGQWARTFPAQANLVTGSGFPVGNHSDTHPELTGLTDAQVRSEVLTAQQSILVANGADTRPLFRFPFGDVDSRVLSLVNGLGYVGVRWTVDTLGWQGTSGGMTAQRVVDRVVAGLQPGEIVLMHVGAHPTDGSTLDADALPQIVDTLRARGYSFVTLDALVRP